MAEGIVIIDKAADWTSMDVCAKLRGILKTKKVGHAGTLDPMATGVLPVFVGQATRGVSFAESGEKEYVATLRLGLTTDTQDSTGNVLTTAPVAVTAEDVASVLPQFTGDIQQIPPMYSAIKINGQKLCDLARRGKEVERAPRTIIIHALDFLGMEGELVRLRVHCSKGTYIRTLCHDIGAKLGCGACMTSLVRTKVGIFTIDGSLTLAELKKLSDEDRVSEKIILPDKMFPELKSCHTTKDGDRAVHNGNPFVAKDTLEGSALPKDEQFLVYDSDGVFIGIFSFRSQKRMFFPDKMFYGVG